MLPTELHDWTPALLGGLAALADAILGVGIILPGEVVVTGLAATVNGTQIAPFLALVILGACLGDHLNYALGRQVGPRLARSRVVAALGVRHWDRGVRLLDRHGPRAIVLTRLIPVVRTLVPAIAGTTSLTYRRFLPASLLGSTLWAGTWAFAGHAVNLLLANTALAVALFAVVVLIFGYLYRTRAVPPAAPQGPERGRRGSLRP